MILTKNKGILQTTLNQRGDHMKTNFYYFQIQKPMSHTSRAEKVAEKMGHLSGFHVSLLSYGP